MFYIKTVKYAQDWKNQPEVKEIFQGETIETAFRNYQDACINNDMRLYKPHSIIDIWEN